MAQRTAQGTANQRRYWWASPRPKAGSVNVGDTERWISAIYGASMIALGLRNRSTFRKLLAVGHGTAMLFRARTGHSLVYERLGVSSADLGEGAGLTIEKSITVQRPVDQVYAFWRDFENLPKFMDHLDAVVLLGDGRSHWDMRGPRDLRLEWDAEIIEDRRNELIAWRSLPGSRIDQSGSVHFKAAPAGRGTEVRLKMRYVPPGGATGFAAAKVLTGLTEQQVAGDMRRFKQLLEAGVVPTTAGQPSGAREPIGAGV